MFPTNQDISAFSVCFQQIRTFYSMYVTKECIQLSFSRGVAKKDLSLIPTSHSWHFVKTRYNRSIRSTFGTSRDGKEIRTVCPHAPIFFGACVWGTDGLQCLSVLLFIHASLLEPGGPGESHDSSIGVAIWISPSLPLPLPPAVQFSQSMCTPLYFLPALLLVLSIVGLIIKFAFWWFRQLQGLRVELRGETQNPYQHFGATYGRNVVLLMRPRCIVAVRVLWKKWSKKRQYARKTGLMFECHLTSSWLLFDVAFSHSLSHPLGFFPSLPPLL